MTELTEEEEFAAFIAMFLIENFDIRPKVVKWLEDFLIDMWKKLTDWNGDDKFEE